MANGSVHTPAPLSLFGWVPRKEEIAAPVILEPAAASDAYTDFSKSFLTSTPLSSTSHKRIPTAPSVVALGCASNAYTDFSRSFLSADLLSASRRPLTTPSVLAATSCKAYTDLSKSFVSPNLLGSPSHKHTLPTSIVLHVILIGGSLLASAWFTDTLDLRTHTRTLLVSPPPATAPAPYRSTIAAPLTGVAAQPRRVFFSQGKLLFPAAIPKQIAMVNESPLSSEPEDTEAGVFGGVPGGVPGGIPGGVLGGVLGGIKASELPPPPPSAPPRAAVAEPTAPVRVGGNVKAPRILLHVDPIYPTLARRAQIHGAVVINAIIDVQGNPVEMRVVSGHPLLIEAAMNALKQWKFEPTILNGEPVAVSWDATITFTLD